MWKIRRNYSPMWGDGGISGIKLPVLNQRVVTVTKNKSFDGLVLYIKLIEIKHWKYKISGCLFSRFVQQPTRPWTLGHHPETPHQPHAYRDGHHFRLLLASAESRQHPQRLLPENHHRLGLLCARLLSLPRCGGQLHLLQPHPLRVDERELSEGIQGRPALLCRLVSPQRQPPPPAVGLRKEPTLWRWWWWHDPTDRPDQWQQSAAPRTQRHRQDLHVQPGGRSRIDLFTHQWGWKFRHATALPEEDNPQQRRARQQNQPPSWRANNARRWEWSVDQRASWFVDRARETRGFCHTASGERPGREWTDQWRLIRGR